MSSDQVSRFAPIPAYPGDPILSLMEQFQADPRPHKVSLSIGVYFDEAGRVPVMKAVHDAATELATRIAPSPYLPMEGLAGFRNGVQALVFGAGAQPVAQRRVATIQTLGGSGALRVGADLLRHYWPGTQVWVSDPTWENHLALFQGAGLEVHAYPYFDPATGGVRFDAMLQAIEAIPSGNVVLLHASCHNPTGADLTQDQWRDLIALIAQRGLLPFVDMAYQGFGDGLDEDAWCIRAMADAGMEFMVANSFSKNFSLYGERVGGLSVVCSDASVAERVIGQLKACVRRNYSSPPTHGARIVSQVLSTPALLASWREELGGMRQRMRDMRIALHAALMSKSGDGHVFDYLLRQRGMFSYTGLSAQQVRRLRDEHGVYLVESGRLCISGLTQASTAHVAQSIAAVIANDD